jgi:hypothetical protein
VAHDKIVVLILQADHRVAILIHQVVVTTLEVITHLHLVEVADHHIVLLAEAVEVAARQVDQVGLQADQVVAQEEVAINTKI